MIIELSSLWDRQAGSPPRMSGTTLSVTFQQTTLSPNPAVTLVEGASRSLGRCRHALDFRHYSELTWAQGVGGGQNTQLCPTLALLGGG